MGLKQGDACWRCWGRGVMMWCVLTAEMQFN